MEKINLRFGPEKAKKLLADRASGKITIEELEIECAYWFLSDECFREIHPKPQPSVPDVMMEYYRSDKTRQTRINSDTDFWKRKDVYEYLNQKKMIQNENITNLWKLKEAKRIIPEADVALQSKLMMRINEFEDHLK